MIYRKVPDTRFFVSEQGDVFNWFTGLIHKQQLHKGYPCVLSITNGKRKRYKVHRLVAAAFHGTSNLEVNHKDGDKLNNHYSNLEWISHSENMKHAHRTGLIKKSSPPLYTNLQSSSSMNDPVIKTHRFSLQPSFDIAQVFALPLG